MSFCAKHDIVAFADSETSCAWHVRGAGKYVAVFAASTAMEEQEWIDRINQSIVFADSQTEFKTTPRASKAGKPRKAARP